MSTFRQVAVMTTVAVGVAVICLMFGYDLKRAFIVMAASSGAPLLFSAFQTVQARESDGWRYLSPGAMEWFGFVGCGAFALLMAYVYNFVGSARSDAARQMAYVFWMMIAFGAASLYCGMKIAFEITRWNDEELQHRTALLQVRTIPLDSLETATGTFGGNAVRLVGVDGTRIDIPLHRNGVDSLFEFLGIQPAD